jgi:hypothetical protein
LCKRRDYFGSLLRNQEYITIENLGYLKSGNHLESKTSFKVEIVTFLGFDIDH